MSRQDNMFFATCKCESIVFCKYDDEEIETYEMVANAIRLGHVVEYGNKEILRLHGVVCCCDINEQKENEKRQLKTTYGFEYEIQKGGQA